MTAFRAPHDRKPRLNLKASAVLFLLAQAMATSVAAQGIEIYSIADQIRAENDCSDPANEACKVMFENTCYWAGETAITMRDGIAQNIPYDRIGDRIFGELNELAEGSGGYVDVDLANSLIEPIGTYFLLGQYNADFAQFNDQSSLALGMVLGGLITGNTEKDLADETMNEVNKRRDDLLRQKWFGTCMQTAYF